MSYTFPKTNDVTDFGFAVFTIDYSGALNNFATLPSGNPLGVYLINGEKVCGEDWMIAYSNAKEIAWLAAR